MDARRIADEFAEQWRGTWVVTLDRRTLFHLRVVEGTRTIAVAAHPTMVAAYVEHIGAWCEAPATCRVATTTDREDAGVRWLTLLSRCPVCLPKLVERVLEHELTGLPPDAGREIAMTPTQDLRGRSTRIGGSTVMSASATARQRLAGHTATGSAAASAASAGAARPATVMPPPKWAAPLDRPVTGPPPPVAEPPRRKEPVITPSTVVPPTSPIPVDTPAEPDGEPDAASA